MTLSIVDFLNARLAEDQTAAEAARDLMDEPWKVIPEGPEEENYSGEYRISNGGTVAGRVEEAKAAFIARHDPARVLREVAAKRAMIAEHHTDPDYETPACVVCQWDVDCQTPQHDLDEDDFPCGVLRHTAWPWHDHPDWLAKWCPHYTAKWTEDATREEHQRYLRTCENCGKITGQSKFDPRR